ncbi:MAG: hypothetical protein A07HN63_00591, partial [uncultured archaeon A07HN63]
FAWLSKNRFHRCSASDQQDNDDSDQCSQQEDTTPDTGSEFCWLLVGAESESARRRMRVVTEVFQLGYRRHDSAVNNSVEFGDADDDSPTPVEHERLVDRVDIRHPAQFGERLLREVEAD